MFITFLAAFFPIMVSTRHAVRALPTPWEDRADARRQPVGRPASRWCFRVSCPVCSADCPSASVLPDLRDLRRDDLGTTGRRVPTWQAYTVLAYPEVFVGIITIGCWDSDIRRGGTGRPPRHPLAAPGWGEQPMTATGMAPTARRHGCPMAAQPSCAT